MDRLDKLESKAIYILREAYSNFNNLGMLWSVGKDSTVMLWLARKAFFGHVPFPLVHIDTGYMIPEMVEFRDNLAMDMGLNMIYGKNEGALKNNKTFPDGDLTHIQCCKELKTKALKKTLSGEWPRFKLNHQSGNYDKIEDGEPFNGVILGVRADEEGSRSKERYFSARNEQNEWDIEGQPPELWGQFKTDFAPGTHIRIHPILDWTELDVWKYIHREEIPVIDLYFDQGDGKRYRSLGCQPCTEPVKSKAKTPKEIVEELESGKFSNIAERDGRAQDKEDGGGLEELRKDGYM